MKTVFFRLLEADDKATALLAAVANPAEAAGRRYFTVEPSDFHALPGSPFAYWVGEKLRKLFLDLPALECDGRVARQGGVTGDDFRWLRFWLESAPRQSASQYVPIAKGGSYAPFYSDLALQVSWDSTRNTFWSFTGLPHRPSLKPASFNFYFRPGLTWPLRTNGLSVRALPAGCIFSHKGPSIFVEGDGSEDLLTLAAITNSKAFGLLVSLQLARTELAQSYEVGLIQRTPIPNLQPSERAKLSGLAHRAWSLKRRIDTCMETSHAFALPALLQVEGKTLIERATAWRELLRATDEELAAICMEIDDVCLGLYGISDAEIRANTESLGRATEHNDDSHTDPEQDEDEDSVGGTEVTDLAAELAAWAVGVAVGRFDVRLATGVLPAPPEPEPFDQLPECSPAMLAADDAWPSIPAKYPLQFPENGILSDDPGNTWDLTAAVRQVFEVVSPGAADAWWNELTGLLNPKGKDLREWLSGEFFPRHLRKHSKSRRKAPAIWQLGVPSGRYSVWIYAHRLSRDGLLQIQTDVVAPKLAYEERKLAGLMQSTDPNDRSEVPTQSAFVGELRDFFDEVKRVTPLWRPTFDDGIALTVAPLWRLVPQHAAWQRELKSKWNELAAGKYDWSHISMHLWPERVVAKCSEDRGLAIAHGLEEVLWIENEKGEWEPSTNPTVPISKLVQDRTSASVKAALKSLIDAPDVSTGSKRSRKSKAA